MSKVIADKKEQTQVAAQSTDPFVGYLRQVYCILLHYFRNALLICTEIAKYISLFTILSECQPGLAYVLC